eukprot:6377481-Alexandrium_andersonii.AAC.1
MYLPEFRLAQLSKWIGLEGGSSPETHKDDEPTREVASLEWSPTATTCRATAWARSRPSSWQAQFSS